VCGECSPEQLAGLIEDEVSRQILVELHDEPMSATALSDRCEASKPTIYRRLDELRRCELLVEQTNPDPADGHHHTVYTTNLDRIVIELTGDSFSVAVDRHERMADRFSRLIEEM